WGVKRTGPIAVQMSAYDPKRNFGPLDRRPTRFLRRQVRYSASGAMLGEPRRKLRQRTHLSCYYFFHSLFFGLVLVRRRSAPNRSLRQRKFCDGPGKGVPAVKGIIVPSNWKLKGIAA